MTETAMFRVSCSGVTLLALNLSCHEVRPDYDRLSKIENQVATLEGQIADISRRRWPGELQ